MHQIYKYNVNKYICAFRYPIIISYLNEPLEISNTYKNGEACNALPDPDHFS